MDTLAAAGLTLWPQSPQWTRTCKGAQGKGAAPPLKPPMQQQGSSCMWRETMWGVPTWPPWASQVLQTPSITLHANSSSLQKLLSIIARNMQPLAFKMSRQAYLTGSKKHTAGQTQPTGAKQGWVMAPHLNEFSYPQLQQHCDLPFSKGEKILLQVILMYSAILFKEAKNLGLNTVFLLKLVKICKYPELSPFPHDKLKSSGARSKAGFQTSPQLQYNSIPSFRSSCCPSSSSRAARYSRASRWVIFLLHIIAVFDDKLSLLCQVVIIRQFSWEILSRNLTTGLLKKIGALQEHLDQVSAQKWADNSARRAKSLRCSLLHLKN